MTEIDQAAQRRAVREAIAQSHARWGGVLDVGEELLLAFVTRVGADERSLQEYGADLALACACAASDAKGLALFERTFVPEIDRYVGRLQLAPDALDELRQLVRVKLFTGPAPRIWQFSGKGPFGAWLRLVVTRIALDKQHPSSFESAPTAQTVDALVAGDGNAEHGALRAVWEPRVRSAIEASLMRLPPKEKTILRLHYIEGLNIDVIGTIYGVHRATVARWLIAIRAEVLREIRHGLSFAVPARSSELRSLVRSLQSQIGLSLSRILDPSGPSDIRSLAGAAKSSPGSASASPATAPRASTTKRSL